MQLLSRVKPNARVTVGLPDTMRRRPEVAAKVAESISEFSNLETMLPVLLAFMLSATPETALAMWGSLENRAAQLRLLDSAAKEQLDSERYDCWSVLLLKFVRSTMKERDRLAHWSWGYSIDLPDVLLLADPLEKAKAQWRSTSPPTLAQFDRSKIYVVTIADLDRAIGRIDDAAELMQLFMKAIWPEPTQEVRDLYLHDLCNEPRFSQLLQAHKDRNKTLPSQPQEPPPDQSGGA
jgi:hypothetical protein